MIFIEPTILFNSNKTVIRVRIQISYRLSFMRKYYAVENACYVLREFEENNEKMDIRIRYFNTVHAVKNGSSTFFISMVVFQNILV